MLASGFAILLGFMIWCVGEPLKGGYFSDGERASVWFVQPPRRFRPDRCKPGAATLRRVGSAATVPAVVSPVSPIVSPVFAAV